MQLTTLSDQIKATALQLLKQHPEGLRYSELVSQILATNSNFKPNTIQGSIWNLDKLYPTDVYKPSRGLFRLLELKSRNRKSLRLTLRLLGLRN